MKKNSRKWQALITLLLLLNVTACMTTTSSKNDPFEGINRKIYTFNYALDKAIFRPIAKGYAFVMPDPAQKGVTHFFNNLGEIPNVANDLLQADLPWTLVDCWRFIINSTIGIAGLLDVASTTGLPKHKQDFGITLIKWGYKNSAYIMLPILGPSTIRDTISIPVNGFLSVTGYVSPIDSGMLSFIGYNHSSTEQTVTYYILQTINVINTRANLLDADKLVDEAFDPYIFIREAYFQNRVYKSNHNNNHDINAENDISDINDNETQTIKSTTDKNKKSKEASTVKTQATSQTITAQTIVKDGKKEGEKSNNKKINVQNNA